MFRITIISAKKEGNVNKVMNRNKSDNPNVLIFITDSVFKNFIADLNNFSEKLQLGNLSSKETPQ